MKPSEGDKKDNILLEYYINSHKIDRRLINTSVNENFDLTQTGYDH